ncbi:MAG: flagellar biosynthetic protein FliO [Terracidiphilus sp.]
MIEQKKVTVKTPGGGLAGWLLGRLRGSVHARPRLEMLERITLAPRQSLALVEAEGRRFLVATSAEGASAFYALDGQSDPGKSMRGRTPSVARVSW